MKIFQITSFYPPHLGGMENVVKEISENLANRGHQVEVFTSDIECKKNTFIPIKNLKVNYLNSCEIAHTPIIPSLFFKLLKIPKDSIMHIHIAQAFIPEVVYLISKIKKIPYIAHIHIDVGPSGKLGFLLPLYKRTVLKKVLKSAGTIVVLNKEHRNLVNKKYNILDNIVIIPNGIGKEFFVNKENIASGHTNLLFVGRLSAQKNIPKIINTISLLKNRTVLHIIGDGEKKKEIEKLIFEKKLKNIILHGKKTGKDLIDFYKNADIFLLTSDYEGLPLVLLEAMASGTPVVASDIREVRELIGNTGILVDPPTPENFSRAIDNLIEDKELRAALAENGRKKAKIYDWNTIVEKFEDVYRNINKSSRNIQK